MSGLDPRKTVFSVVNRDDTSLALPSVNQQHRTGQERVREQVQTVRRTKSRHSSSKSGSISLSPTSPLHESNGSVFFGNGFSKSCSSDRSLNSPQLFNNKGTSMRTSTAFSRYMRNYALVGSKALGQTNSSRSEPAWNYGAPKRSIPTQRLPPNTGGNIYRNQQSSSQFMRRTFSQPHPMNIPNGSIPVKTHNHFKASQADIKKTKSMTVVTDGPPKTKVNSRANGTPVAANITMKEAVEHLSSKDENYQLFGASYIQHNTFTDDKSKEEVLKLKGIPLLLTLLCSSSSKVKNAASAALRNLSFKSNPNKQEICRCEGIPKIVDQLKKSDSVELDKQLTGLLWNLSSVNILKSELLKNALPVLMERVIQPYTTGPEQASNTNKDPDVFTHTTECLRNLSSADQNSRQTMRKCPGLIDSLATYIKNCVDKQEIDNESLESCVCILHNLTFQLEAEMPGLFNKISALAPRNRSQTQNNGSAVGCFASQSKSSEHNPCFDYPVIEDPRPNGAGWLIHSKTLQSYLSLLELSHQEGTQEACCGAMHNLTSHKGTVSDVMSDIIVRKLNGTKVIAPLLKSDKVNLQRNTMFLLGNLIKNPNLHSIIGHEALPTLMDILRNAKGEDASDDTLAIACQSASTLLLNDPEGGKDSLDEKLIKSLHNLSNNIYLPKSSKTAAIFLYKIWSDKDLQSFVKKNGMNKSWFVNNTTLAAYRSVQVVD